MHELLLFLTGIIVGVMNAIAGGGMLLGFPVLVALGIPPLVANASTAVITTPGQIASAWGYRDYLRRVPHRFAILLIPLVIGGYAGARALLHTPADEFAQYIPWLVLFGVLLFTVSPLLHFHLREHLRGHHRTITPLILLAFAMLPLSFYGGYFGAGFGFMMLAFLSLANMHDAHVMNAMKNVGVIFMSMSALLALRGSGLIDWHVAAVMGAGTIIGGYAGARGSQKISSKWLRIIVIVIGLVAVAYLAFVDY